MSTGNPGERIAQLEAQVRRLEARALAHEFVLIALLEAMPNKQNIMTKFEQEAEDIISDALAAPDVEDDELDATQAAVQYLKVILK